MPVVVLRTPATWALMNERAALTCTVRYRLLGHINHLDLSRAYVVHVGSPCTVGSSDAKSIRPYCFVGGRPATTSVRLAWDARRMQ